MAKTISAPLGASTAVLSTETDISLPHKLTTRIQSEFSNRGLELLEQECRDLTQTQTTAIDALELGKRLLFLKAVVGHGNWLMTMQRIGIAPSSASRLTAVAIRILSLPGHARLIKAVKSKTQLFELLALDDEELEGLSLGASVRGISLSTLPQNSVAALRSLLRDNAPEVPAHEPVATGSESLSSGQSAPVAPPTADALVGEAQAEQPLQAGDRVESLHAGRPGRVVRTYDDGSACICWDDGEPQPEGLGHERMPRQLLIRVSEDPVSAADTGETCITREEALLISAALIVSLRKNGTKRLLSVEDIVEMMLANGVIQTGGISAVSISTIIRDLRIYGLHPEQLLTPEPTVTQLDGESGGTTAPFSGRIDPGEGQAQAEDESAAPTENIEDLPSVFSMARGEFADMEVTLMIHAGKIWMIAEEIAAVLGQTPEEVAEIEGVVGQLFERQATPGAYARVRIASMEIAARLLDAQAIELLAFQLDTPAASSLADWMAEMSAPGEGWSPSEDEPAAPPMNDGPTLAQQFEQLGALHHLAWEMLHRVSSQIGVMRVVADDQSRMAKAIDMGTIADIAANLVAGHDELLDDMEMVIMEIERRLFNQPEPGMVLPESVWLELVSELSTERDAFSNEDMLQLAHLASKLRGYAFASPEVTEALKLLEEFSERHGARLYNDHTSDRVAFSWLPGRSPIKRFEAASHH